MKSLKNITKYLLASILILAAIFLFLVIVGEQSPDSELSSTQFWLIKAGAITLIYVIILVCKICNKNGVFSINK